MDLLLSLPTWYVGLSAFGFGVIIGSFLNVVIYRFHTGKSLAGSSHCLSCQSYLRWYELFPLLSYLGLRGRCRTCSAYIPSRYFWVELITGLLFVGVVLMLPYWWWVVALPLVSLLVVVAVYDIYHMIIPQSFIYLLWMVVLLSMGLMWYEGADLAAYSYHIVAAFGAYLFFASLWKVSHGRWIGYGDAKLAAPLGALVGPLGTFSMLVLSFWIGTAIALSLLLITKVRHSRGQQRLRFLSTPLTMKSEVPFAPFLIIAFLVVFLFHADVLTFIAYVIPV